jgi:hypothetical protein
MCHNGPMEDYRIPINPMLRRFGITVGILMMVAGLILGWLQSGQPVSLPPTGFRKR